jgi:hypothetical protein
MSRKRAQLTHLNFIRNYILFMNFSKLFAALRALFALMRLRGAAPHFFAERNGGKNGKRGAPPFAPQKSRGLTGAVHSRWVRHCHFWTVSKFVLL